MGFQVIAGSGHCGTMWLARVLNSVPGQRWHHELRTKITGMPWWEADDLHPADEAFDDYFSVIEASMGFTDVGDSNSWPPESLPEVNERVPIERVIYLTRDKEAQLHSLLNHSPIWRRPEWPDVCYDRIDRYAEIAGRPRTRSLRLLVEANDFMPPWLREQGLDVDVYSLEELTTDVTKLRELAPLTDVELFSWQKTDINRKVPA